MLKILAKLCAAALLTTMVAIALLANRISAGVGAMSIHNGDWVTNMNTGSEDASVLQKATIAIGGLLASTRENSMYYRLSSIADQPLMLNCRYRIEGHDYDADWWSITAYGWDNYLIPNSQGRYSFNNENLIRDVDGSWSVAISAQQQTGNWLPIGPSGAPNWAHLGNNEFDLLLRLYTPGISYLQLPATAELPTVTLEACE